MHMRIYKIAVINLGSTSTKIAYYENENCLFKDNIVHTARALEGFSTIWEQFETGHRSLSERKGNPHIRP